MSLFAQKTTFLSFGALHVLLALLDHVPPDGLVEKRHALLLDLGACQAPCVPPENYICVIPL